MTYFHQIQFTKYPQTLDLILLSKKHSLELKLTLEIVSL